VRNIRSRFQRICGVLRLSVTHYPLFTVHFNTTTELFVAQGRPPVSHYYVS